MASATSPSESGWRRKACMACTSSKRQCNKQTPSCRRCRERGIVCEYPLVRQICAPLGDIPETSLLDADIIQQIGLSAPFDFNTPLSSTHTTPNQERLLATISALAPPKTNDACGWFLSSASWEVKHFPPQRPDTVDADVLQQFIATVQTWLRQWISEGQNPFIHKQLYAQRMPRSIRDAYTSLTAYQAKNPANERMTLQIIEDNAAQLLRDDMLHDDRPRADPLDHLARVQALLVYQAVRLFDGDIRARERGELAIPILYRWVEHMWEAAKLHLSLLENGTIAMRLASLGDEASVFAWRMWIISESIRRTWLTAKILLSVYLMVKNGWAECPGRTSFTTRKDVWTASSAYSWSKACQGLALPRFLQSMSTDGLFGLTKASDVDEFSIAIMSISFGSEKVERWIGDAADSTPDNWLDSFLVDG